MKRAGGDFLNVNGMGCDIYPGSRSSTQNQLFLKTCFKVFCCEDLHNSTSRLHIFVCLRRSLPFLGNVSIYSEMEGLHQLGIRGNSVILVLFDVPCYLSRGRWFALFGCLGCELKRSKADQSFHICHVIGCTSFAVANTLKSVSKISKNNTEYLRTTLERQSEGLS